MEGACCAACGVAALAHSHTHPRCPLPRSCPANLSGTGRHAPCPASAAKPMSHRWMLSLRSPSFPRYRVACSMPSMPPARRVVNDYY
eukprot:425805-Pelagomonas_calceolata.AAC.2